MYIKGILPEFPSRFSTGKENELKTVSIKDMDQKSLLPTPDVVSGNDDQMYHRGEISSERGNIEKKLN
jgi:hypothetical protein